MQLTQILTSLTVIANLAVAVVGIKGGRRAVSSSYLSLPMSLCHLGFSPSYNANCKKNNDKRIDKTTPNT